VAAEGFTTQDGLTYSYEADAMLARLMHRQAIRTVVLATARKLSERDRIVALKTAEVHALITGSDDERLLREFRERGVEVIRPSRRPEDIALDQRSRNAS
jgi:DeoR/GlpR family transcriptional regulator of sugar metabolism